MNDMTKIDAYGTVIAPATIRMQRLLPGPIERVWSYITDGKLRRQWLASGDMDLTPGAPFELVWRNDELSDPPGKRPEGFPAEDRMKSEIIEVDAPRRIAFTWLQGEVSMELETVGKDVLLTVVHQRISNRANMTMVGAGWHTHLDALAARLVGREVTSFWDSWVRLREEYERRIPE